MDKEINNDTPVTFLTVGQLKEVLGIDKLVKEPEPVNDGKKYVYGIPGLARLFNCSTATANRIKRSGKIDIAIKQLGRKIIVDADLALELAGLKKGGRK